MEVGSVVRAMFDFSPSVSEELTLFAGDVIEVLSVIDEFWLIGNKEGITGTALFIFAYALMFSYFLPQIICILFFFFLSPYS